MNVEYQQAVTVLRDEARRLRRVWHKNQSTVEGAAARVRANALEQLAGRIKAAVPSDPDDEDLGRIAAELMAAPPREDAWNDDLRHGEGVEPPVIQRPKRKVDRKVMLAKAGPDEPLGRTKFYVHIDDYGFTDARPLRGAAR